jgi:DNA polymerase/3'-5' exonuclease PolX
MVEARAMNNQELARQLRNHARALDVEGGNLYRVRAYRRAAQTLLEMDEPAAALLDRGGRRALETLPGIGSHISLALESLIQTGEMPVGEPAAA